MSDINDENAEFERLHEIVSKGMKGYVEAGEALAQIHERKLWHVGGFETWADYCRSVAGMSRIHAHRLIKASQCLKDLRAISDFTVWPVSESQVRPLLKLKSNEDRRHAWNAAVIKSEDHHSTAQPTAEDVQEMVVCILKHGYEGENVKGKSSTPSERRAELVSNLRTAISERKSWEDVEKLLAELEKLI